MGGCFRWSPPTTYSGLSETPFLNVDLAQHLAIPTNGSDPTISEHALRDASLSAISLPLIPVFSGTQRRQSLCRSATLSSASCIPATNHEWAVAGTASALRAAWLSH